MLLSYNVGFLPTAREKTLARYGAWRRGQGFSLKTEGPFWLTSAPALQLSPAARAAAPGCSGHVPLGAPRAGGPTAPGATACLQTQRPELHYFSVCHADILLGAGPPPPSE